MTAALRWVGVRATVGIAAVAVVLGLSHLTITLLVMAFSSLAPYAG